jgi:uncharacterized membrane protein
MVIPNWALLAIISAILFGLGDFIVVYSEKKKMDVVTLYITYTIIIGLLNLIYLFFFKKESIPQIIAFSQKQWLLIAGLCVTYLFAYLLHFVAIQKASNPGYANALVMFHVVVLTGLSYMYLAKPLNSQAIIGIGLIFVGGAMVTMYS